MKADELMIGDWVCTKVQVDDTGTEPVFGKIPQKVVELTEGVNGIYVNGISTFDGAEIEPIPLTKEILKKNGWKRENDKKAYMVNYDSGQKDRHCWCMWCIKERNLEVQTQNADLAKYNLCVKRVVIPCNYVHELQHALRICGIEKHIEL